MHVAVARNKFAPGVDAPGVRWGKWTPEVGEPTYDWRAAPRSAGNTRGVYCAYAVGDRELLLEESQTDDHLVQYYVVDSAGSVLRRQPRIRKGGLPWVLSLGYAVEVDVLFADVDNPGHSDWTPRLLDKFREQLRTVEALQTCGYYTTSHGARLFQDLDEPVPASESERYLFAWLSELEAAGVTVDWGCRDWTRHFRLPYVRRAGVPTKPTLISVASSPRTIRPGPVAVKSIPTPRGRGSKRRVVGRCAAALPETWTDRAVRLGAALVPFTEGSNHELSLCLAGALLERGVSPEAVPAVVVSAANAAGWRGRAADHHWRNAEDTVMKWATGARVRTDVPPSLVPVLDEVCQVPPAPEASPEVEADKLRRAIAGTADGLTVVRVSCGGGKALAIDTPIPTPRGWKTMGELQVGDVVFDELGKRCNVTFATEIMHDRRCFEVVFDDGSSVIADAEHRWRTWSRDARVQINKGRHAEPSIVTTEEMAATVKVRVSPTRQESNHAIEVAAPLDLDEARLPIHPYALGVWLGDGDAVNATLTSADEEMVGILRDIGVYAINAKKDPRSRAVRYTLRTEPATLSMFGDEPSFLTMRQTSLAKETCLTTLLREIRVLNNKHIPRPYLRASASQRMALLQGLMDTDGTVKKNGSCEISLSLERLAKEVHELCLTLGMRATFYKRPARLYGKDCGFRYRVRFTPHVPVFRLKRKLERQHSGKQQVGRTRQRFVVEVRERESVPVRCITVDSPSHLYLASRYLIPTHNTRQARLIAAERAAQGLRTTISVPTNELALQVVSDLREAGVAVARYFGPTSLTGEGACRFRGAAAAIAHGQQSVRWELCEGRGKEPCPYLDGCQATVGAEGPDEVLVVVGNHGLLGELEAATGKRGLLIVDEPPDVLEDLDVTARDLALAKAQLGKFEEPAKLAPAIALAEAYLKEGRLDEPVNLAEVDLDVPSLGDLLAAAQAEDVQTAIAATVKRGARAPALVRWQVAVARANDDEARRLGEASATMALLYRALTDESVRVTAYEDYATRERRLSVASVEPRLKAALRRDGRVVAMAADAHLHLPAYREVVCYEPTYVEVSAKDGCQVRRVLLERAFSRRPTPKRAEADAEAVRRALDLAVDGHGASAKVAVVTFKAREEEVAAVARAWASERDGSVDGRGTVVLDDSGTSRSGIVLDGHGTVVLDVAHYGALRGLDRWKHYDALVTVGDPVPNLSAVSRTLGEGQDVLARARDLARAELEQAHGRLRTVHRDTKCTVVHVGRCVAYGWPPGFESATVVERQAHVDVAALVMACGGLRASSRLCGVSPTSVKRWVEGTWDPPTNAVALLQAAVAEGRSGTGRRRRGAKGSC